jgi:undecaprenyl diphosphate synthase
LWECAYAELHFVDCMWPDFDAHAFDEALTEFARRDRRFGAIRADGAGVVHG